MAFIGNYSQIAQSMSSYSRVKKNSVTGTISAGDKTEYLEGFERELFYKRGNSNDYELIDILDCDGELLTLAKLIKHHDAYIAGGSVASSLIGEFDKAGDIDIFCASMPMFESVMNLLEFEGFFIDPVHKSELRTRPHDVKFIEAVPDQTKSSFKKKVQIIKMVWYKNIYDVLESFDMFHVKMGLFHYCNSLHVVCHKAGLKQLREKRIVVHNTIFPVSLMRRIKKYTDRGFTMLDGDMDDMLREMEHECKDSFDAIDDASALDKLRNGIDTLRPRNKDKWNDPEYQRDYYLLTPEEFKRKWTGC